VDTVQEDRDGGLLPETLALMRQVDEAMPRQSTDEEATERANEVPSGTRHGWVLNLREGFGPLPCADRPDTHRHLMFEA
jgi:hypothetical protein